MNLKRICVIAPVVFGISACASLALADGKVYPGAASCPNSSASQDMLPRFGDETNTSGSCLGYVRVTYTKEDGGT
ncbi:MAG: hypothetical protein KTR25_04385 [Myxococcales bacterium]|nr:hypothetical protein [Myxococcales bacterium]